MRQKYSCCYWEKNINVSEALNISHFSLKLTRTGVNVIALYNLYSNEVKLKKINIVLFI